MRIYVTVGVRTSQGPGPGPMTLPVSECNALIGMKYATPGDKPPNDIGAEQVTRPFGQVPYRRVATSN